MRLILISLYSTFLQISIHAPLTGCDPMRAQWFLYVQIFQSTHPLRDATKNLNTVVETILDFNPRTPYGMRPQEYMADKLGCHNFNPRTPYGMRRLLRSSNIGSQVFQSTHPLRDATVSKILCAIRKWYFNPRTPYGMRHKRKIAKQVREEISIHAPLTGCDVSFVINIIFNI